MSKRKTVIELQSKPENKVVRQLFDKIKPVDYAPINLPGSKTRSDTVTSENQTNADGTNLEIEKGKGAKKPVSKKLESTAQTGENNQTPETPINDKSAEQQTNDGNSTRKSEPGNVHSASLSSNQGASAQHERLRIFQASTPVTRTITRFQKAAIVVRGENGKQLVELLWRDQMNEKTRDIWDFLVEKFVEAEKLNTSGVSIRKREILDGSGVKSDRTFISGIYTLEDMGLIEVKRLSGNKEGNVYVLTDEGKEEIDSYKK